VRIMTDTNVIISAIIKENSICDEILNDICVNHELVLCDYIINESYNVAKRKFPYKIYTLDKLFAKLKYELVSVPRTGQVKIKDVKDQPILNAALKGGIDILISGDIHFLEIDIEYLEILSPADYRKKYL